MTNDSTAPHTHTEDLLRTHLRGELEALDLPPLPAEFHDTSNRTPIARRALIGAAAAGVAGIAVVGKRWRTDPVTAPMGRSATTSSALTWSPLTPMWLTPRASMRATRVGNRALFFGGLQTRPPCPPAAFCVPDSWLDDGTILDPDGSWRRIGISGPDQAPSSITTIGDTVIVVTGTTLLAVEASTGNTHELAPPKALADYGSPTGSADHFYAIRSSDEGTAGTARVQVLDVATGTWTSLPPDPLGRSFDRTLTWTDAGLVLFAKKLVPNPGGADGPAFVRAALFDGTTWRAFPDLDCIGGTAWHWTGARLVCPELGGADGGERNGFGRVIPFGGRLDPRTGEFTELPNAPATEASSGWLTGPAAGSRMVHQGWLYDDSDGSWTALPRPPGGKWIESAGVLFDDRLVVAGGYDLRDGYQSTAGLTNQAWSLALP